MQRRYRTKKYSFGEYLEVAIYPVYAHPRRREKQRKVRGSVTGMKTDDGLRTTAPAVSEQVAICLFLCYNSPDESEVMV